MRLEDLTPGTICVYDCYEDFTQAELVEIIKVNIIGTYYTEVSLKELSSGRTLVSYSCDLTSLEKAEHILQVTIEEAQKLQQEIKSQLNKK